MEEPILKVAIQKKGRLSEKSLGLLKNCGISLIHSPNKLLSVSSNFPLQVLFLRDDDIPHYVSEGVADLGIVGENVLIEKNESVDVLKDLGFGKCRLSLAVPRLHKYDGLSFFNGKKIATTYPNILRNFLDRNNIQASIETISGSVEIAPGIGLADAVCDLVSTGSTLLMNGLEEVEVIFNSQAQLIGYKLMNKEKSKLLERIMFRLNALNNASRNKYVLLNAPNEAIDKICDILPGMRSPTVLPLAQSNWSSVHSVLPEDEFWEVIDQLRMAGAEGILVCPIEKMIV